MNRMRQTWPSSRSLWIGGAVLALLLFAGLGIPYLTNQYWMGSLIIPFLIFALSALGLNFLTGYAGQLSLGHAAFMGVGAYGAVILYARYGVPLLPSLLGGGVIAAAVGALFGLPALRIKGFYLAVSTLAGSIHHRMGDYPCEVDRGRRVCDHRYPTAADRGLASRYPGREVLPDLGDRRRPDHLRQEPRAQPCGARLDGHPRSRHRR